MKLEYGNSEDYQACVCARCQKDLGGYMNGDVFDETFLCDKCIDEVFPE